MTCLLVYIFIYLFIYKIIHYKNDHNVFIHDIIKINWFIKILFLYFINFGKIFKWHSLQSQALAVKKNFECRKGEDGLQ